MEPQQSITAEAPVEPQLQSITVPEAIKAIKGMDSRATGNEGGEFISEFDNGISVDTIFISGENVYLKRVFMDSTKIGETVCAAGECITRTDQNEPWGQEPTIATALLGMLEKGPAITEANMENLKKEMTNPKLEAAENIVVLSGSENVPPVNTESTPPKVTSLFIEYRYTDTIQNEAIYRLPIR